LSRPRGDTISQIFLVWIVTTAIGLAHLHRSIVGSIEVLSAIFADQGVTWAQFGHATRQGQEPSAIQFDGPQPASTAKVYATQSRAER
jgi:hypothetical protein